MKMTKIATMMGVPVLALVLATSAQAQINYDGNGYITLVDNTSLYSAGDGGEFRAGGNADLQSQVDWLAYSTIPGKVTTGLMSDAIDDGSWGYNSGLAVNGTRYFQTFCTELNEEFYPGGTYNVTSIGNYVEFDNNGGTKIPLALGVAYLYSQFAAGTLAGYDYTLAYSRQTTWDLQNAIWDLLGEGGYMASWIQTDLGNGLHTTSWADWTAFANGRFGVSDMVLGAPGAAQDQLVMTGSPSQGQSIPVPEPSTIFAGALMLLPFGASTLRILRKQRTA